MPHFCRTQTADQEKRAELAGRKNRVGAPRKRLARRRKQAGYSQERLAEALEVDPQDRRSMGDRRREAAAGDSSTPRPPDRRDP